MEKNQRKAGATLSYILIFLSMGIGLAYTPFMLRMMGQSEFGLYSLAGAVVGYMTILDFGFGNAMVRYTAKYRALNDKENEYNLNGMFIIIYSGIGFVTAILGFILVYNVENMFAGKMTVLEIQRMKILIEILTLNLAISFPLGIFSSIITGYEKFIFSKGINIIRVLLTPCIMIPLLFAGYKSIGLVVVTTILSLTVLFINMWFCLTKLDIKIHFRRFNRGILREVSGYSFYIFLIIIVDKINWSADQFILGVVSGTAAVAVYSIALQFNSYYLSFSMAITGVFLPRLTGMVANKATEQELSDLFIRIGRVQFIVMAYILGGFLLVGQDFITIWAGENYNNAFLIAVILMIPVTIPNIQNLGLPLLQAQNRQKFCSIVYILIAVLNVAVSIPLAILYGGTGAAIGTAGCLLLGNGIIMNVYYYKYIHLDIPQFWKEIGGMTLPAGLALGFSWITGYIADSSGAVGILIKGFLFTVLYIAFMWRMGMNGYEKGLFIYIISKLRKGGENKYGDEGET